jgi:hypothetical protein
MMVGSEKLLLVLSVPAEKEKEGSLTVGDAKVVYMEVQKSWSGKETANILEEIRETTGSSSAHVLSNNASTMSKAINSKCYIHVRDAGHIPPCQVDD